MSFWDWLAPLLGGGAAAATTQKGRDFLFGDKDQFKRISTQTKPQMKFQNSILNQLMKMQRPGGGYNESIGLLQDYLDPDSELYQNYEAPYLRQFNEQTIPGLAERFAGFGANSGALSSSGFGQALGAAGAGLQENLAGLKSNMQRQSIRDLLGQYNQLASYGLGNNQFQNVYQPGSTGLLGGILGGVGQAAGAAFGGPAGAGFGQYAGNSLANLFR